MCKRQGILYLSLLCFLCSLLLLGLPVSAISQDKIEKEKFTVTEVKTMEKGEELSMQLIGNTKPAYTVSERFSPFRVVVDIADASFSDEATKQLSALPENDFVTSKFSEIALDSTSISRFEFTLADSHTYTVKSDKSGLNILFSTNLEQQKTDQVTLQDIKISKSPDSTIVFLVSNKPIFDYKIATLRADGDLPPRMYIDVNNADLSKIDNMKDVGTKALDKIRISANQNGGRIVFNSASSDMFDYSVLQKVTGLQVVINEDVSHSPPPMAAASESPTTQSSLTPSENKLSPSDNVITQSDSAGAPQKSPADSTLKQLLESSEKIATTPQEDRPAPSLDAEDSALSKFNDAFIGFNKERISVDFYKIDLHNVFRLFREVSGLNILVDEAVSGNLTIAMNDVPWDFALDVILNLKGLAKEERYNTIVIYPKDKAFTWPSDSGSNLTIEADTEIITQEELIIEESANQPQEILLAKEILAKAKNYEAKGNFTKAVESYAKAHELWPDNAKIVDRLTTIYLVNLRMNARALHYAKQSLKIDQNNTEAALYAAISSANMGRTMDAAEFFRQSVSDSPPSREALASFAAFSENNGNNDSALKLLRKLHSQYGESIESMVAVARILDKKGEYEMANRQYSAILASGFQMRPALRSYITERLGVQ